MPNNQSSSAALRPSKSRSYKCIFCGSRTTESKARRFHRFPRDPESLQYMNAHQEVSEDLKLAVHMSDRWAILSGKKKVISESVKNRTDRFRVCSDHFTDSSYNSTVFYRLRFDAVPTPHVEAAGEQIKQRWENYRNSQPGKLRWKLLRSSTNQKRKDDFVKDKHELLIKKEPSTADNGCLSEMDVDAVIKTESLSDSMENDVASEKPLNLKKEITLPLSNDSPLKECGEITLPGAESRLAVYTPSSERTTSANDVRFIIFNRQTGPNALILPVNKENPTIYNMAEKHSRTALPENNFTLVNHQKPYKLFFPVIQPKSSVCTNTEECSRTVSSIEDRTIRSRKHKVSVVQAAKDKKSSVPRLTEKYSRNTASANNDKLKPINCLEKSSELTVPAAESKPLVYQLHEVYNSMRIASADEDKPTITNIKTLSELTTQSVEDRSSVYTHGEEHGGRPDSSNEDRHIGISAFDKTSELTVLATEERTSVKKQHKECNKRNVSALKISFEKHSESALPVAADEASANRQCDNNYRKQSESSADGPSKYMDQKLDESDEFESGFVAFVRSFRSTIEKLDDGQRCELQIEFIKLLRKIV